MQQVTVAVVDSGVDSTHPDLAYAGGQTWVREPSEGRPGDMVDAGVDFYGHGTHIAGIIGARNNGAGVVGVAPSVPIYSLKVLDGAGQGALSDALDAVKWAASNEGHALNIKVINLSIASYVSPAEDDYSDALEVVCDVFQEASDAGILVVTSAGNYQESLLNYLPAACPTVAAVTSIDPAAGTPSAYSNWLPANASDAAQARVIAAPGNGVLSTMSIQREASRYRELSGTSQAAPHVAGIAATCILSGACASNSTGLQKLAVLQAAARERLTQQQQQQQQQQQYGFAGDPATPRGLGSQKYYGYLAWSKFWQR
ncbi:hypothetical protein OEZ86_007687 [Tetradesmus obliquus]|nr:hypothetical protein OEZ86_007687 [Tetradesmus obliquus]